MLIATWKRVKNAGHQEVTLCAKRATSYKCYCLIWAASSDTINDMRRLHLSVHIHVITSDRAHAGNGQSTKWGQTWRGYQLQLHVKWSQLAGHTRNVFFEDYTSISLCVNRTKVTKIQRITTACLKYQFQQHARTRTIADRGFLIAMLHDCKLFAQTIVIICTNQSQTIK